MDSETNYLSWAIVGIVIPVVGFLYNRIKQTSHKKKIEKPAYVKVGEVQQIYIYGIDGGHPIEVPQAACIGSGLRYRRNHGEETIEDRNYVVYTANSNHGYFVCPKLVTVCLSKSNTIRLETSNGESFLEIELTEVNKEETILVGYHTNTLDVFDCGDRAAEFLSEYLLGRPIGLRLGQFVQNIMRRYLNPIDNTFDPKLDQRYLLESMKPEHNSFSLISDKTINHIQGLHGCGHVTPKHFRVHIVIGLGDGTETWQRPFIEDNFEKIRIGSATFANVTLRTINRFVNVDPETGIRSGNAEPLQTLHRFRQARSFSESLYDAIDIPLLGINMGIEEVGIIRIGDAVKAKFKDLTVLNNYPEYSN